MSINFRGVDKFFGVEILWGEGKSVILSVAFDC